MARTLLGQNVMLTPLCSRLDPTRQTPPARPQPQHADPLAFTTADRLQILRFAASFVWADCEVVESERRFLDDLARELDVDDAAFAVAHLVAHPPVAEEIDPRTVPPALADVVRQVVLRAIAADGRVDRAEMAMFELLDDLLPGHPDDPDG